MKTRERIFIRLVVRQIHTQIRKREEARFAHSAQKLSARVLINVVLWFAAKTRQEKNVKFA